VVALVVERAVAGAERVEDLNEVLETLDAAAALVTEGPGLLDLTAAS